jgi:hypothetical protein
MNEKNLLVTCPLCGRKNEYALEVLFEGSVIKCPFCQIQLTLHGHMWKDIQMDMIQLQKKAIENS